MFQLMTVQPKVSNNDNCPPLLVAQETAKITFDNVSFSYSPDHNILSDLSFTVPAGSSTAIVGGSTQTDQPEVIHILNFFIYFQDLVQGSQP